MRGSWAERFLCGLGLGGLGAGGVDQLAHSGEGLSLGAKGGCGRLGCCSARLCRCSGSLLAVVTRESCKMKINCQRRLIRLMSNQEQPFIAVKC